jgi:drug/metabolite transporter (DMT)-like permease
MPALIGALLLWSSLGVFIKLSDASPVTLVFFPCVVSLLPLFILIITQKKQDLYLLDSSSGASIILLGIIALINTGSYFFACHYTSIANAVFAHYTAPLFVAMLAPLFLQERLTLRTITAIVIAAYGLWMMLGIDISSLFLSIEVQNRDNIGILFGILSGITYALALIIIRKNAATIDPYILTFGQNLVIVIFLLPFVTLPHPFFPTGWFLFVMGIMHSTLAPVLYFRGMRNISANKAAICGYLEPVSAVILAALFLGENISFSTMLGGSLILISGYISRKL